MPIPTRKQHNARVLDQYASRGFDQSTIDGKYVRPRCSQCEVLVINGTACHETGCTNSTRECAGCSAIVPARVKYCEECS